MQMGDGDDDDLAFQRFVNDTVREAPQLTASDVAAER